MSCVHLPRVFPVPRTPSGTFIYSGCYSCKVCGAEIMMRNHVWLSGMSATVTEFCSFWEVVGKVCVAEIMMRNHVWLSLEGC